MTTWRNWAAVGLALVWPATARAGVAEEVDAFVKGEVAKQGIPGLAVAVVREGKVDLARGYGMANVEWSAPATPDTVFELASVSKQFTATAVMLLVGDGKLAPDDAVVDRLPGTPRAWAGITLRHLLGHTSGIKDYLDTPGLSLRDDYADDAIVKLVADAPPEFPPGTRWAYSNTNYALLGMIVARASGRSFADFSRERIFGPLGMASTRINDPRAIVPRRAAGYEREAGGIRLRDWISPSLAATGDGGVVSSALDLARWDAALDGEKLLKRPALRQMWSPGRLADGSATDYGFGWALGGRRGHPVVGHTGGFPGTSTCVERYPADKLTVIVLANLGGADATRIARGVADRYVPSLAEPRPAEVADEDPATTAKHKAAFLAWVDGKLDPALFTPEAKKALFPDQIGAIGKQLAGLGKPGPFTLLGRGREGDLREHRYRATLGKTALEYTVTVDAEGKIAGVLVRPE